VDLSEECFPRDKELGGMIPRWGHCFRKDRIQNSLIIKDGDDVVSHVGCIEQDVMVDGGIIRVSGISSVATKPTHRGRGLMTRLLKESIKFMKDEGYVLSDLGGDRIRYHRFGWELAGRNCRYSISIRSLSSGSTPGGFEVERLSDSRREMEDTLALHNNDSFGLLRDEAIHDILLHRLGNVTLLAWKDGEIDAYAVANVDDEKNISINEVAGGGKGIECIVRHLFLRQPEGIVVRLPYQHPLNGSIRSISSGWGMEAWRQFKIIDLVGVLEGFSRQIESRISVLEPSHDQSIVLGIDGEETAAELTIGSGGVGVEEIRARADTARLSEQDMVLLLFGSSNPHLKSILPPILSSILPLDFYLWKNEAV
jgi:GNAT superfamily N-acetyltransferase